MAICFSEAVGRSQSWDCIEDGQPRINPGCGPLVSSDLYCKLPTCEDMYGLAYLSHKERACQVQNLDIFNPGKTCVEYLLHMLLGWLLVSLNQPDLALRLVAGCTSLIFP
jgi:hypothetical protein